MKRTWFSLGLVAALGFALQSCDRETISSLFDGEVIPPENSQTFEYVDLGLSVKWATCNVGAEKPQDFGYYFAWGETAVKSDYSQENYNVTGCVADDHILKLEYDAVHANLGGKWRMPTAEEWQELVNGCNWRWANQNGVYGCVVTNKNNSNKSIFIPAGGIYNSVGLTENSTAGYYWSSSSKYDQGYASYCKIFDSNNILVNTLGSRFNGMNVRPVYVEEEVNNVSLNCTSLVVTPGTSTKLSATFSPSNATDRRLTWKCDNTEIAEVDGNGNVTAKGLGTALITVATANGKGAACMINVIRNLESCQSDVHEFVDLGLSVYWATCNFGADTPEGYGNYITDKDMKDNVFDWAGYWRIPLRSEWQELIDSCDWTKRKDGNYIVTSRINSKSIVIPFAGYYFSGSQKFSCSYYRVSEFYESSRPLEYNTAYHLIIRGEGEFSEDQGKEGTVEVCPPTLLQGLSYFSFPVRAVYPK